MSHLHLRLRDRDRALATVGVSAMRINGYRSGVREPTHTHDILELVYVLAGRGRHRLGRVTEDLLPGSLGIIQVQQDHHIATAGADQLDLINLFLDPLRHPLPTVGEELQAALSQAIPAHPSLHHRQNAFVHLRLTPRGNGERALLALLSELERGQPGYREAMRAHLRVLLVECARAAAIQMPAIDGRSSRTDARIALVLHELDRDPTDELRLPALAKRHDLAVGSLCRAFKRYTGMTVLAYQQRARVRLAQAELSSGERSIVEIALACGFSDVRFFQRVFKRIAGTTPTAWRARQS